MCVPLFCIWGPVLSSALSRCTDAFIALYFVQVRSICLGFVVEIDSVFWKPLLLSIGPPLNHSKACLMSVCSRTRFCFGAEGDWKAANKTNCLVGFKEVFGIVCCRWYTAAVMAAAPKMAATSGTIARPATSVECCSASLCLSFMLLSSFLQPVPFGTTSISRGTFSGMLTMPGFRHGDRTILHQRSRCRKQRKGRDKGKGERGEHKN